MTDHVKPKNQRSNSPEAVAQQAVLDLIERDAQSILERWYRDYLRSHKREPSDSELDRTAQRIINTLTSDRSRYHYSNLKPVWSPDGKTWHLERVHEHS